MAAPEHEHVVIGIGIEDLWQTVGGAALQDGSNVGRGEVAEAVVDGGAVIDVDTCVADAQFAGMRVVGMAGHVVLADEHDMVVIIAVLLQEQVHGEDIALETVVGPAFRGGDEECPAVVEGGIGDAEQFGLTPSSRSRIIADSTGNRNEDEMEALLGGDA